MCESASRNRHIDAPKKFRSPPFFNGSRFEVTCHIRERGEGEEKGGGVVFSCWLGTACRISCNNCSSNVYFFLFSKEGTPQILHTCTLRSVCAHAQMCVSVCECVPIVTCQLRPQWHKTIIWSCDEWAEPDSQHPRKYEHNFNHTDKNSFYLTSISFYTSP